MKGFTKWITIDIGPALPTSKLSPPLPHYVDMFD
jgi:hypothetical protein